MKLPYYRASRIVIETKWTQAYRLYASGPTRNRAIHYLRLRSKGFHYLDPAMEVHCIA